MPRLVLEDDARVNISQVRGVDFYAEKCSPRRREGEASSSKFTLIIHGLNSHARNPNVRAMSVALAIRGTTCVSFDLPGHGECASGDHGDVRGIWTGRAKTLERIARALDASDAPESITIVGSSMGGALAIYAANELKMAGTRTIERVILINPLMRMKMYLPGVALAALRLAAIVAPGVEVSSRPQDKVNDDDAPEGTAKMDFDDEGQKQCDADELTYKGGVTLRTGVELYALTRHNAGARAEDCGMVRLSFTTPVLLLTGGRDEVVDPDAATQQVKLAMSAGGKVEHKKFPNAGHSLTLQSRREEVFDLVADWRWL